MPSPLHNQHWLGTCRRTAEGQEKILDVWELVKPAKVSFLQSGGCFATPEALGKRL